VSLRSQIKAVQSGLPITVMHEKWVAENPDPVYSPEAQAFAAGQLAGITGSMRRRKRMFRASAAGTCKRRQVLAYIGHPQRKEEITSTLGNIFATGNFLHLKWQMQGLTAGWLIEAEVPMDKPEINAGGTADGKLVTKGGFEFKSINDRGFTYVMTYGPKLDHQDQTDNYMYLGDMDHYSIVYENKNNGEWREFRREREEANMRRVAERFDELNTFVSDRRLPKVLDDCQAETGVQFRQCPFRDTCLKMKMFPRAAA